MNGEQFHGSVDHCGERRKGGVKTRRHHSSIVCADTSLSSPGKIIAWFGRAESPHLPGPGLAAPGLLIANLFNAVPHGDLGGLFCENSTGSRSPRFSAALRVVMKMVSPPPASDLMV